MLVGFGSTTLDSDVTFAGYIDLDGFTFPQVISIQRPIEDYTVRITFQPDKLKLNDLWRARKEDIQKIAQSHGIEFR